MRKNVDANSHGFNRDENDGTKEVESFGNVERAGEEGAPEGWVLISSGWVVPGLDEVAEFLVEQRKSQFFQRLRRGASGKGLGCLVCFFWGGGIERGKLVAALFLLLYG